MEKMTIYMTDPTTGTKIPVEVKVNKNLNTKKQEKRVSNSKLRRTLAATGIVLMIGTGVLSGCTLFNQNKVEKTSENNTSISQTVESNQVKEESRFDVNTKENVIDNAVFLIEEAARCGKELDAEDAVLAAIAANSNDLTLGFMGELFGEREQQTYTYNMITDAYLKACLIQLQTVGVAKSNYIAFNMENIFASNEDYEYLNNLRTLTTRFNTSVDENEKNQIITELNEIALDLCTYNTLDISSPASVLAMLSLDGMRIVTNNMETPILHNDIRDEMFGNNTYSCKDANVLPTAYSNRVSDLKLDNLKAKLDGAVLAEGKTPILNDIIMEVKERTKDVQISNFDAAAAINKILNSGYVDAPTIKDTNNQIGSNTPTGSTTSKEETKVEDSKIEVEVEPEVEIPAPEVTPDTPVITPTITNPEVTTPTEPEISVEENVTPEPDDVVIDTGNVEQNKQEAEEQVKSEWEIAQADSNQGSIDGMNYGLAGSPKPSFEGKSQYYINAFNASYDVYYQVYIDAKAQEDQFAQESNTAEAVQTEEQVTSETTVQEDVIVSEEVETTTEDYDLDSLSTEQLNALRDAALGAVTNSNENGKSYTK